MNRRNLLLGGGLLVAFWLAFFADAPKTDDISAPVERKAARAQRSDASRANSSASADAGASRARAGSSSGSKTNASAVVILALQEREDLFGASQDVAKKPASPTKDDKGNKSNKPGKPGKSANQPATPVADTLPVEALFDSQTWTPPPPPPPKPAPPPPPVAPPLPFTVIGKKLEDEKWEVYLARGEQTFIAKEKGLLDNQYRVESIKPPTMTLTYLPLNQTQTLTIGGTD
jgi:hypothetical protein